MTKEQIKEYLTNTPTRYDKRAYDSFLKEHRIPKLPPAIHITGTNGKGSTAYYLALSLQNSGYNVGLYTSPSFKNVNELACINGEEISDEYISECIKKYDKDFKKYELSLFEIMTFISFNYFADNNLDYVVIEVGMGGLLDATNVFTPLISIITNIGLDHLDTLGPAITDVAEHKAGVIKKGVPVLLGDAVRRAEKVVLDTALKLNAPVYRTHNNALVTRHDLERINFTYNGEHYTLYSGALYEVNNAVAALDAIEILKSLGVSIKKSAIKAAFKTKPFEGRFNVIQKEPAIIVDGSHNPHAIRALLSDIKVYGKKLKVVFAAFNDKDYFQEIDLLILAGATITLTTFDHPRAVRDFGSTQLPYIGEHKVAIKEAVKSLKKNDMLLIVGSLYFARLVIDEFKRGEYA